MNRWRRPLSGIAACLVAGAVAWFAFGAGPGVVAPSDIDGDGWQWQDADARDVAASDAVWSARRPWGVPAAGAAGDADAATPPAIPVGTVREADALVAVFLAPDGTTARLRAGDEIPGGGRVDAVTEINVSWTDSRGDRHEQHLLVDPLPYQANFR